jgi:hypothetical protein
MTHVEFVDELIDRRSVSANVFWCRCHIRCGFEQTSTEQLNAIDDMFIQLVDTRNNTYR